MNKKIVPMLLLVLLCLNCIPLGISGQTWENEYGKLEVYPDTSFGLIRQKQYYNATWYKAGNYLDIAFCFDEPLSYGKIFYWNGIDYVPVNVDHVEYNDKSFYVLSDIWFDQDETKHGFWEYDVKPMTSGKWDMYIKLSSDTWQYAFSNNRLVHLDPWWNSNWDYKKKITLDHDQVPGALVNFPVLINLSSDVDLAANVGFSDGRDIAFTDGAEAVQLNHEIEFFKSSTGQLVAWVNVTSLSSVVDTDIYMYYGNDAASNQSDPTGVWDSDFVAVYHMTGPNYENITDSTSNWHNASSQGDSPTYNSVAVCGRGVSFDGVNDRINVPDSDGFSFTSGGQDQPFTVEAVYKTLDNNDNPVISKYSNTNVREWFFETVDAGIVWLYCYDESLNEHIYRTSSGTQGDTRFYYNAATYQGNESHYGMYLFLDGVNDSGVGDTDVGYVCMENLGSAVNIGYRYSEYFKGVIDEIRISNGQRSDNWIITTYNCIMNATNGGFFVLGGEERSPGTVEDPTGFYAVTNVGNGSILLNWTAGLNSTCTRLEYHTMSSWGVGNGNLLYNGTNLDYYHDSVNCNVLYYYRVWAYNSTQNNWSGSPLAQNISCPGPPTGISTVPYTSALNITWTSNVHGDTTLVLRKSGSIPSSPTDGTVLYNGSNLYYNDTTVVYGTHYYALFSYNETVNRYSGGASVAVGSLNINVYDENTSSAITGWDVFISNEAGTQVYESTGNSNTLTINIDDLPLGDVTIVINQSDYVTRIFDMTLETNTVYFLDAYLAWNDSTEQYMFLVVGPQNEYGYEPPIEDATIYIKRYINESTGWGNVTIRKTSASGVTTVGLIPKAQYHITIVKSGYDTFYDVIVPPPIELEGDRLFTFRLRSTTTTTPVYDDFWDQISFTAVMTSPGYLQNGNITLTYSDSNSSTVNTRTYLYEVFNSTITLKDNYYQTGDSFSRKIGSINTTRYHYVVLYFNNTASFQLTSPVMIPIYSLHKYMDVGPLDLDARITNVIGSPPVPGIPWSGHIAVVIPVMVLVLLGVFNTGVGIVGCGLSIGLVQGLYAGYGISINPELAALAPLIIIIGVVYIWSKHEGVDTL